jgi:NAD(P)-dependent dehydrogenase (short-subunit alcohol dehydrogenase family)
MGKVWMITGAAKGIGRAIALAALDAGNSVVVTTRKVNEFATSEEYANRVLNLQLDVSDTDESVFDDVVQRAINRFGRIDVLVNNAGSGRITNFEETAEQSIRGLFEVNVFGLMRMTRAVLPVMRKQKAGHIFNIASGAGYSAGPVAYHTSKFAVTGFSTSLSFEVAPFGIQVINVAPGLFRTSFYDEGAMKTMPDIHISDYDDFRWQTDFIKNNSDHNQPGNPDKLAKLVVDVANIANPPLHLPVGEDAVGVIDALKDKLKEDVDAWRDKASKTSFE